MKTESNTDRTNNDIGLYHRHSLESLCLGWRPLVDPSYHGNPPAPKVLGRDLPDGTRKRLQVYLGGGGIFRQNLLFLIGRDARLQKTL